MNFTQEKINGALIKQVHLTCASKEYAEKFKHFLLKDIENNNLNIIADLTECEFIDSTFISALVTALKSINQKNGSLKIIAPHSTVKSVLELTGMGKVFNIFSSREEALSAA
jgi:anti-anti-sigma factor